MTAMPNSVAVLEDFYGEQISPELIQRIRNTPYDQLLVLADRMVTYNRSLERAKLRPYMVSSGKPSDQFERNQVFLWDDIYFKSPGKYSLSESPYFKYALMYTDRIVVPDLSLDWAEELIWGEARGYAVDIEAAGSWLADEVRGILPVAPLVREGVLITAPSCDNLDTCQRDHRFTLGTRCMELDYPIHSTFSDVFFDDPYLAWIFINSMNVERWELEALDLHRPEDIQDAAYHFLGRQEGPAAGKVSDAYRTAYGPHVRLNDIRDAVMLNLAYREANLVPMTSSSIGRTHLTRSAKVVMDGLTASDVAEHDAVMAATEYRVPPISNVSLDDLMRLRLQEDIYEDVRGCLVNLVNGVANYNSVNYRSYEVEVREAAEDLVRPTYERLNSRRRQDKLASIVAGYAVGSVISMAFNAVASMLTGPLALGGHHAARVAGGTGRRAVARRVDSKGRELSVATSVLLSVMDQPK